ncbi:hypothetical protein BBP40_010198 [Aspergillus hancockii]|nr:hypothetical protein BBP40_010198 [Aspergillus hancockii]
MVPRSGIHFWRESDGRLCGFHQRAQKHVQAVLVTKFKDFEMGQRRRDNSAELLGIGVFNADGQTWEHGRALVRPNFTRKQVADLGLFEKHVQRLFQAMPTDGTKVDIQEWTLDTGTDVLFSESNGIAQRIRFGRFARFYCDPQYTTACKIVHDYVNAIVAKTVDRAQEWHDQRSEKPEKSEDTEEERYTFLNALAREGVEPKQIRDQILNILVAARDTSACLMSAAVFELARIPEYQAQLRQEIEEKLNGRHPTFEYLPFNAGPRICPGQQFALVETSYVLVRLLQEYSNIKGHDNGAPWKEHLTLTCSVGQGVWASPTK